MALGFGDIQVSISHTTDFAIAFGAATVGRGEES
jgi:hypothetical protein